MLGPGCIRAIIAKLSQIPISRTESVMTNPVLVEVTRGGIIESRHRGSVVVVDSAGKILLSLGDRLLPVFPRSAIKALQALPMVESGAPERFGLGDDEIALACASHTGSAAHVRAAASMLAKAGMSADSLECGVQPPRDDDEARELARQARPALSLHNNCSGKHAGFVCLACAHLEDPRGYVNASHPVQQRVRAVLEQMTGQALDPLACGTDGCSIPTYAISLVALAGAFARFGSGVGLDAVRARAATRIRKAVAANPVMVGGEGKFDTLVMRVLGEQVFCKIGAEGVYCAALPDQGLGVAIKIDDGAARAAECAMGAMIRRFVPLSEDARARLGNVLEPELRNWNGILVGQVRSVGI